MLVKFYMHFQTRLLILAKDDRHAYHGNACQSPRLILRKQTIIRLLSL